MKVSRDTTCVRCEQRDDLLGIVAELKEEVERLRSIRGCEQEIDWWSNSVPYLQERHLGNISQTVVDPLPCYHQQREGT